MVKSNENTPVGAAPTGGRTNEQLAYGELAESIEQLERFHEGADHGGEPCLGHRAGTVAFFAHRLGLRSTDPEQMDEFRRQLERYEAGCAARKEGEPHSG